MLRNKFFLHHINLNMHLSKFSKLPFYYGFENLEFTKYNSKVKISFQKKKSKMQKIHSRKKKDLKQSENAF